MYFRIEDEVHKYVAIQKTTKCALSRLLIFILNWVHNIIIYYKINKMETLWLAKKFRHKSDRELEMLQTRMQ